MASISGHDTMLTYIISLYLDAINTFDAGQPSQPVEQVIGRSSQQQVETAQGAAQPVQALVHTLQCRPAVEHIHRTCALMCMN